MAKQTAACGHCLYFREGTWCSNAQSPLNRKEVAATETCAEFSAQDKKAPAWMRLATRALGKKVHR